MENKKLYRIEEGKMLCGVCGGIAEYLNIDVTVIRLIAAVLTVCGVGTGVLLYAAGAIIMPVKPY